MLTGAVSCRFLSAPSILTDRTVRIHPGDHRPWQCQPPRRPTGAGARYRRSSIRSPRAGRFRPRGTPTRRSTSSSTTRIFATSWQYACPLESVAEPGAFTTMQAGHVPVVIVRGRDGELRGFVNVCRHRGHLVATESGCRETLQCPYHAWTYDLDGTLRRAPRSEREPGFDPAAVLAPARRGGHLGPVRVRESFGVGGAARRGAGRPPGARRLVRHRPVHVAVPLAPRVAVGGQLEGRDRELPRVLPLRGRTSGLQQGHRRAPGRVPALRASPRTRARSAPFGRRRSTAATTRPTTRAAR